VLRALASRLEREGRVQGALASVVERPPLALARAAA
jgi:hypothetical protein